MNRQARVLQQRIQVIAVERRGLDSREGVGGKEGQSKKRRRKRALNAEDARLEFRRQAVSKPRNRNAEQSQNQYPEEQRALVVAPDSRDFVQKRFGRMRVPGDKLYRKIRNHECGRKRRE